MKHLLCCFLLGSGACGSTTPTLPTTMWSDTSTTGTHWTDRPLGGKLDGELQAPTDLSVTPYHFLSSVGAAPPLQLAAAAPPTTAAPPALRGTKPSPAASPQPSPSPRHLGLYNHFTGVHFHQQHVMVMYVIIGLNVLMLCALTCLLYTSDAADE